MNKETRERSAKSFRYKENLALEDRNEPRFRIGNTKGRKQARRNPLFLQPRSIRMPRYRAVSRSLPSIPFVALGLDR